MKFDFWKWYVEKDDVILSVVQSLYGVRSLWGIRDKKYRDIGRKMIKELRVNGGDVVIVLNGPSAKEQPIERIKGKDSVFVNQGFRLPCYKEVHPKYHVFVDTKMIHGIWDVKWLDEILEMVPDITFVMPASWARTHLFDSYIERNVPIIWLPRGEGKTRGHGVSGAAFDLVQRLGYKRVYFTGYEATSFAGILLKHASHFYGNDADEATLTATDIMKGYYLNARHIREVILSAERMKKAGIEVYNLTKGGILEMFERKPFEEVFPK